MRIIETKTHGYIDYMTGCLLLILPGVAGLNINAAEGYIPMGMGVLIIVYSLLTNYEFGIKKVLSMKTHLFIDLLGGIFLAASPWLFGFYETIYAPHVFVGILSVVVSLFTKTKAFQTIENDTIE